RERAALVTLAKTKVTRRKGGKVTKRNLRE
ncbi:hypothetical protein IAE38_003384, partial [Pseudomonas sp. S32]|nr:hypothetical protein [Pseudomonas sp. S32]